MAFAVERMGYLKAKGPNTLAILAKEKAYRMRPSYHIPLGLSEAHIPGEHLSHGRSKKSVETISTEGQQYKQHAKDENLPSHCSSGGIDKLGQESVKEEGRLGIK